MHKLLHYGRKYPSLWLNSANSINKSELAHSHGVHSGYLGPCSYITLQIIQVETEHH